MWLSREVNSFCSIYDVSIAIDCRWLLDLIDNSLPVVEWILLSDFNMVMWEGGSEEKKNSFLEE